MLKQASLQKRKSQTSAGLIDINFLFVTVVFGCYVKNISPLWSPVKKFVLWLVTTLVDWAQPWEAKKNLYVRHLFFRLCNRRPFECHMLNSGPVRASIYARHLLCAGAMKRPITVNPKPAAPLTFCLSEQDVPSTFLRLWSPVTQIQLTVSREEKQEIHPNDHEQRLNCFFSCIEHQGQGRGGGGGTIGQQTI